MVKSVTFLGVLLDDNLSWKDHIKYIENKVMNKLILNKNSLHQIFFISNLGFCLELGLLNSKTEIGIGVA